jgi:RNA polymerase sigma-70 factor (ECF subfamily)
MDNRSDKALVDAVLAGDVDAFGALAHRYRDAYTRYAVRMLGNRDDADDALQLAFIRAFRALGRCREPERFRAWLYQIVINECRTYATRRGLRERRVVRGEGELDATTPADPTGRRDVREEIQRALDRLDPTQREAFVLKHVEELSYEEMSELTGQRVSALKMRVKRACDRLRELLEGVHHD